MSSETPGTAAQRFAAQVTGLARVFELEQAAEMQRAAAKQPLTIDERLTEAGRIRAAWKDTEAELPALIAEAIERGGSLGLGKRVGDIARMLGVTQSYVYRVHRAHRAAQAAAND
ncbi:hypothetical protein ACH4GE_18900 [Streptomyces tendae]|uniref:hypothetical protein n=1 Tax=Streptomyces TaxID=1883 RepID=UPI0037B6E5C8